MKFNQYLEIEGRLLQNFANFNSDMIFSQNTDQFKMQVQTRVSVLTLISKYTHADFLASLSVFRNQRMNTFECLNLHLKLVDILRENRD